MARPARPERSRSALSLRQLSRFCYLINSDMVFGTHSLTAASRLSAFWIGPIWAAATWITRMQNFLGARAGFQRRPDREFETAALVADKLTANLALPLVAWVASWALKRTGVLA